MENVSLFGAFIAGVLSFISPCVLPLIPGYLSFISGVSLEEMRGLQPVAAGAAGGTLTVTTGVSAAAKRQVIITSLFFILGFSLVFVSLGASATFLGQYLMERLTIFGKVAGVLLIIFGLHTIGVFKIPFLLNEARVQANTKPASMIGAVIVGISFAFGWTPCIGPILSAILLVAAQQDSVNQGIVLLSIYSLGLAIPFLLTAIAINQFFVAFKKIRRHYHAIEIVSGLLMIVIGLLIFFNRFTIIAQWLTPYLPTF
ncbi:MAG TPA: cytochrome c biogenesis protein CcdA [Vicinamibacterales bacterium]|nr:cytochrome c biogenesis protein CcdA [Vicinamibacterales bacterium]